MTNHLMESFLKRMEARYAIERDSMSMSQWICENTTLNRAPFTFERYPFQRAIADDMHDNLMVIKCSQVGLTEIEVRKFLGVLQRYRNISAIFTLPNEKMFKRISKTRIRPIVDSDAVFNLEGVDKPIRSQDIIQIEDSFGYITGCTEGDATSIDADFLFHDEEDLSPGKMIGLFQSRLQNSDYKVTQKFSTPTHVDYGVDSGYKLTDQRELFVKCDCCGHWQLPLFTKEFINIPNLPDDVSDLTELSRDVVMELNLSESQIVCSSCRSPLDLGREDNREWIAEHPSRTAYRGYRVRPFSTNRRSVQHIITQLIEYRQQGFMRGFYNTVLGEAYTNSENRLSEAQIRACFTGNVTTPDIAERQPVFVGIDIGQVCHLVLSTVAPNKTCHVIHWEELPVRDLIERVDDIQNTYNLVGGTCDRHPYTPKAEALFELTQGKILPVEYRGTKTLNIVKDHLNEISHGQVERTSFIDRAANAIRARTVDISGYGQHSGMIVKHLRDMVRDEPPDDIATWIKLSGQDHFFHALAFNMLAIKMKELIDFNILEDPRGCILIQGLTPTHDDAPKLTKTMTGKPERGLYNLLG